jgi:hypothetical protein
MPILRVSKGFAGSSEARSHCGDDSEHNLITLSAAFGAQRAVKLAIELISATTESILFNPGKHMVAVSAQTSDGSESDLRKCAIMVQRFARSRQFRTRYFSCTS